MIDKTIDAQSIVVAAAKGETGHHGPCFARLRAQHSAGAPGRRDFLGLCSFSRQDRGVVQNHRGLRKADWLSPVGAFTHQPVARKPRFRRVPIFIPAIVVASRDSCCGPFGFLVCFLSASERGERWFAHRLPIDISVKVLRISARDGQLIGKKWRFYAFMPGGGSRRKRIGAADANSAGS